MHPVRNVFVPNFVYHRLFRSINRIPKPSSIAVTLTSTQSLSILSRSRARLVEQNDGRISRLPAAASCRHPAIIRFCSSELKLGDDDVKRKVEDISEKFKEAMELLDDARSSAGTVYFSDDMMDAENAIAEVLSDYETLMKQMSEDQKRNVVRTIGLKIEELKAQVQMLKDSLKE